MSMAWDVPIPPAGALVSLWQIYGQAYAEIEDELSARFRDHPQLGRLISDDDPSRRAAEDEARQLLERAIVHEEWDPYLAHLRTLATHYAHAGVSLHGWMSLMIEFRKALVGRLADAYEQQPDKLAAALEGLQQFKDLIVTVTGETFLEVKEDIISRQHEAIAELSTPVLPLTAGIVLLPIVGVLDSQRASQLTEHLLESIRHYRARVALIDVTGVAAVDSAVANHLLQTVKAVRLMGAHSLVSGMSPANAKVLVRIGVDLEGLDTVADLQSALAEADRILGRAGAHGDPGDPVAPSTR